MIKRLAGCVREYRRDTVLAPLFMLMEVIFEVIIPLLMAAIIDNGIAKGNMSAIGRYGAILIGVTLLSMTCGILSGRFAARASAGFAKNLRHDMYYNIQTFSFGGIDKYSTSGLVTRLTTDVTNVQNSFQMIIRIMMRAPGMLIFALIMAFRVNARLSLIFVGVMPVLGITMFLLVSRAYPTFQRVFKIYDKMNNVVQENLRGIRVVKSYVREEHEIDKFQAVSTDIYNTFTRAERLMAYAMPAMLLVVNVCMLLIAWFGGHYIVGGTMTTGQLTSLISYTMQILMSFMMISMIIVMITISRASAERISEVLAERSDLHSPPNAVTEVPDGAVEFDHVGFAYLDDDEKQVLHDIDLNIASGQTVGIIGGTGSAKSSLVQLIPRLYDVRHGAVRVGGVDVRDYGLDTLRGEVAMVLQKNELFSGTIRDNLRWGDESASDEELERVCKLAQADDFIRSFPDGYDTIIEQGGTNISGGQKQRLCIARALLKKPKILILDDSTSAVDTRTDALIRKAMREEIPGTTKIIIAQRVASVEDADVIVVLDGGRIHGVGTHEQLLEGNDIYREVYTSQKKGGDGDDAA